MTNEHKKDKRNTKTDCILIETELVAAKIKQKFVLCNNIVYVIIRKYVICL